MNNESIRVPCLSFTGRRLFVLSGEQNDEYVRTSAVYDLNSGDWQQIQNLPSPHGRGLSCCFLSDQKLVKSVVVGGYSQKNPLTPSSNISIYDDYFKGWKVISFPKLIARRLPPFVNGAIYVSDNENIHIQLMKDHTDHFELNLQKGRFSKLHLLNRTIENKDLEILKICSFSNERIGILLASKESADPSHAKLSNSRLSLSKKLFPDYYTISTNHSMSKSTHLVSLPKNSGR